MKLNTAFHILLAVICTASRARARATSFLCDPRTVEEKEPVQRQTMGDHVSSNLLSKDACDSDNICLSCGERLADALPIFQNAVSSLEEAKSLACTAVSKDFEVCQGCQGFSQVGREVHIPGCVGMTSEKCKELATLIVGEKPDWFKDGEDTNLVPEQHDVGLPSEMAYYKVGLPVSADDENVEGSKVITGVAGDCMVHYPWDWCVDIDGSAACLKLPPWDCSKGVDSGCLSSSECCAQIQGEYPGQDINGNELLCYEWVLPSKSSESSSGNTETSSASVSDSTSGSSGGVTGNRLVIHLNRDKVVALPAVITDGNYMVDNYEEIIETQQGCTSTSTNQRFPDDPATLRAAVKDYVDEDCANESDCAIGKAYGWPINSWCVEQVTSFEYVVSTPFTEDGGEQGLPTFNEDINGWTTSQVTDMNRMFMNASVFNQPLDNWDVSSVTNLTYMFSGAKAFNQPLNSWDLSSVTVMKSMFAGANVFNQNLCQWGDHLDSGVSYQGIFYYTACSGGDTKYPEGFTWPTSADGPWCQVC